MMTIWLLTICISGLLANPFPDENKIEHLEGNMIHSIKEKKIVDDKDDEEGEEYDDDDNDYETRMDGSIFEAMGANMTLDRGSNCDPTKNDWKCCSTSSKCDEGEGDCDKDSHCEGSLKCGANNCRELYGDDKSIREKFDCCYNPGK